MPPRPGSARTAVGNRLRDYRKAANLSGEQLAERMGLSQSWISRVESGTRRISIPDANRWLDHVQAGIEARGELAELVERADVEAVKWAEVYAEGQEAQQRGYDELARDAEVVRVYQELFVPGVLQTASYAAYLRRHVQAQTDDEVGQGVTAQLRRQEVLYRPGTRFEFVVTEAVLRRRAGGSAIMAEQLHHLVTLANLPTVDLRVLPVDHDMAPVWGGSYDIYQLPDEGDSVVLVELVAREVREVDPDALGKYQQQFELVQSAALDPAESTGLLRQLADQYTDQAFM